MDRYKNAPAMQVAHRSHVINMLSAEELRRLIELEKPNIIVPEIGQGDKKVKSNKLG